MRKNRMMRLASVLLVCVLLTTSVISGTFAKYTTKDSGADFARVAKWGVTVEAKNFDMFTIDYATDDKNATFEGTYSVSAAGTGDNRDDILAPGTAGSFADIKITGTPEVAVDVAIVATVVVSENWVDADGAYYCPVAVTVGTKEIRGLDYTSATDFANAIAKELNDKSSQYAPNEYLDALYDTTNLDISWAWAFEGAEGDVMSQDDVKDTFLGDAAAKGNAPTISVAVAITVEQID